MAPDNSAVRRSGRLRVSTEKSRNDVTRSLDTVLGSESGSEDADAPKPKKNGTDHDFTARPSGRQSGTDFPDLDSGDSDVSISIVTQQGSVKRTGQSKKAVHGASKQRLARETNVHSRGIRSTYLSHASASVRHESVSGPGEEDLKALIASSKCWRNDYVLPDRRTLRYPFSQDESQRYKEATSGWNWYYDFDGRNRFRQNQKTTMLRRTELSDYLPKSAQVARRVLLGPHMEQQPFACAPFTALDINECWYKVSNANHPREMSRDRGWMVNVGARVRCLDWSVSENPSLQTFVVGVETPQGRKASQETSAFRASPPFKSIIQIWTVSQPSVEIDSGGKILQISEPRLSQMICSEWGDAQQLKWCPVPRDYRNGETEPLLAGVFDDGYARVIDTSLFDPVVATPDQVQRVTISEAAITIPPLQGTVTARLAWLSPSDIAIGYSNGYLSVYSIAPQPGLLMPRSTLQVRLHATYILSLSSCYPSFPDLLLSSSISGHTRLTSLSSSQGSSSGFGFSTVQSRRTHAAPPVVAFHHALHGAILPEDGKEILVFSALRSWGTLLTVADGGGSGGTAPGPNALDVGKSHACIAWGTNDGCVTVTNPIGKALKGSKERGFQITVCRHEWARQTPSLTPKLDPSSSTTDHSEGGMSRITEGYRPQPTEATHLSSAPRSVTKDSRNGSGVKGSAVTTIFEDETAATAVSWNPNAACGTWLAMGWGAGWVRVQDVGASGR